MHPFTRPAHAQRLPDAQLPPRPRIPSPDAPSGRRTLLRAPRLLVVPGLRDSGPAHWQSWLEAQEPSALRVRQRDFAIPDLARWSARIDAVVAAHPEDHFVAVAHSFGTLALVDHLARRPDSPVVAGLLVAPADPDKFGLGEDLPRTRLAVELLMVYSLTDPWMGAGKAQRWAQTWGANTFCQGAAGHINAESGHGPLPVARRWVDQALVQHARERGCELRSA